MIACYERCPSPMSEIYLEHMRGAATRVGVGETAFPLRAPGYNFLITGQWSDPAASDENIAWTRSAFVSMEPFLRRNAYVNYLADDETGDERIRAAYGTNYNRLVEVKRSWDPDNLFRLNQNIRP